MSYPPQQPHVPPAQAKRPLHQRPWVWAAIAVVGVPVFLILLLVDKPASTSSTASQPPAVVTTPSAPAGSTEAAAGIPPMPDAETRAAYLAALDAIDPDIVHGKEDTAVSRGRSECSSILSFPGDKVRQVEAARERFTSPDHPEGFGVATASRILKVVHQHLCPTY